MAWSAENTDIDMQARSSEGLVDCVVFLKQNISSKRLLSITI